MKLRLYNTLSQKVEEFVPINDKKVNMYVCGPTVYNHPHIGNARPMVVYDLLKRVLQEIGYDVFFVSNYTDIDDKIIAKSIELGTSEKEVSDSYIKAYEAVRFGLNVLPPDRVIRVTEVMDKIIDFISDLVKHDWAYQVGDNVYFRVDSVSDYGCLSHQNLDQLLAGSRIDVNQDKVNPHDFVLWKLTDDVGIKWDSPFGMGRPGWHSECVVMINEAFGVSQIDIHGGGVDLRFPHHENERAQNCALHDHDLARYWVHNAMIQWDGVKMSKSLNNVVWAKDLIAELGSNVTRWLLLGTKYNQALSLSDELFEQAKNEVEKIRAVLGQIYICEVLKSPFMGKLNSQYEQFMLALCDDLNVPNAVAAMFECIKQINQLLRLRDADSNLLADSVFSLRRMLHVLGIEFKQFDFSDKSKDLIFAWHSAKLERNFELADKYRLELISLGIL